MAYSFPEGASFAYAPLSSMVAAATIETITNANPALVTDTAHGLVDDNVVLFLSSAWPEAGDAVYKVDQQSVDTFNLVGLDTTSTTIYPATAADAEASYREIETADWVAIPQVLTIATNGGDPRFTTISPLARRTSIQVPTGFNPLNITLTLGYDPADSTIAAMQAIGKTLEQCAFRLTLADGAITYGFGYMVTSDVPAMASGQANTVTTVFSLLGKAITYPAP